MSHKGKHHDDFHFSLAFLIRLILFILIVSTLIYYFSSHPKKESINVDPTVLGDATESTSSANPVIHDTLNKIYLQLPESSRKTIENFDQSTLYKNVDQKINELKKQSNGFPQKQIKEVKKMIVKSIYDDMIKSIDK